MPLLAAFKIPMRLTMANQQQYGWLSHDVTCPGARDAKRGAATVAYVVTPGAALRSAPATWFGFHLCSFALICGYFSIAALPPSAVRQSVKVGKVTFIASAVSMVVGWSIAEAMTARAMTTRWSSWPLTFPPRRRLS